MTVRELIDELKQYNDNDVVLIPSYSWIGGNDPERFLYSPDSITYNKETNTVEIS